MVYLICWSRVWICRLEESRESKAGDFIDEKFKYKITISARI